MAQERHILEVLQEVVDSRKGESPENSRVAALFEAGQLRISRKINEEAFEVIQALENETPERVASEIADLLFHVTVGMSFREDVSWKDVFDELEQRRR